MESVKLVCRVCGKEYEPCRSARKNSNTFHWQEVACSPECGAIYLQRINESRSNAPVRKKSKSKPRKEPIKETPVEVKEAAIDTPLEDQVTYGWDAFKDVEAQETEGVDTTPYTGHDLK